MKDLEEVAAIPPPNSEPILSGLTRRTLLGAAGAVGAASLLGVNAVLRPDAAFAAQAWGGYANGYIPLSAMVKVSYPGVVYWAWGPPSEGTVDGVYLEPGAASALVSMLAAYAAAAGSYLRVNEGYRSYAGQLYWHGREPYPGGAPGSSNHGWGKAVDFESLSTGQRNWLVANCASFNYQALSGDPVHFSYIGPDGAPVQTRRQAMFAIIAGSDNIWWFVNSITGNKTQIASNHLGPLRDAQWWFFGYDPGTRQLPVSTFTLFQQYIQATD